MMLNRRNFLAGSAALCVVHRTMAAPVDPYDVLIAGQYANDVQFIMQQGGQFLGPDFKLGTVPTSWTLRLGRYKGRINGKPVDYHGYWIYVKGQNKCWQAGAHGLAYWNQDGRAVGSPEDWELFNFRSASKPDKTVRIQSNSGSFVNLVGDTFMCNDKFENAAIFTVAFV